MSDFIRTGQSSFASSVSKSSYDVGLRKYMLGVYNNMGIALAISGLISILVSSSPELMSAIFGSPLKWLVMFAPLVFVFIFGAKINSMSVDTARACLWGFAALMGLSLAPIFLVYTGASIARAFFITASLFGAMSLYGYTTKKDLTGMGSFLFMGLIGVVIASLVNIFLKSSGLDFVVSILSVIIFTGLTAYDSQRIKSMYYQLAGSEEAISKAAIMGALSLYMDFINLFITMLRFFGDRRE